MEHLFLIFFVGALDFSYPQTGKFQRLVQIKRMLIAFPLSVLGVFGFVVAIWPYLWADLIRRLLAVFQFYKDIGVGPDLFKPDGFDLPFGIDGYPISLWLTQAPLVTLILAGLGVGAILLRRSGEENRLKNGVASHFLGDGAAYANHHSEFPNLRGDKTS